MCVFKDILFKGVEAGVRRLVEHFWYSVKNNH